MTKFALKYPYFIIMLCLVVALIGTFTQHDKNTVIDVRGAVVSMGQSFKDFGFGLIIAVLLVYTRS